jgi:hypothetical protein
MGTVVSGTLKSALNLYIPRSLLLETAGVAGGIAGEGRPVPQDLHVAALRGREKLAGSRDSKARIETSCGRARVQARLPIMTPARFPFAGRPAESTLDRGRSGIHSTWEMMRILRRT